MVTVTVIVIVIISSRNSTKLTSIQEVITHFEIMNTMTPWIVRHEVQLLINPIYNKF